MTIKERFESLESSILVAEENMWLMDVRVKTLEARMKEKDEEIDSLCTMINELRKELDCNSDHICDIWDCILEEDIPEEEENMERRTLCDVYADCEACPDFEVCDSIRIEEDEAEEEWADAGCDCAETCEECPFELMCSDKCNELMEKIYRGM